MFDSFLGNVKGYLGKAFVLTAWLPVFVFACLGLVVYLAGNRSFEAVWHAWLSLPLGDQVAVTIAFLAPVTLLAFVIHHLEGPIVRFFEGYWENWFLLRNIGRWKCKRYKRYLETLEKRIAQLGEVPSDQEPSKEQEIEINRLTALRNSRFPPIGDEVYVMPTLLGNIYRTAELYPLCRYGADAVVIWPRLRAILPGDFVERLQDAKIASDFFLLLGMLSVVFSLITVPYLIMQSADLVLIISCALGLPLGILAYRCALAPTLAYTGLIKVAFDLYRRKLLEALGLGIPSTLSGEQKLWENLSKFIAHGITYKDFQFTLPTSESA